MPATLAQHQLVAYYTSKQTSPHRYPCDQVECVWFAKGKVKNFKAHEVEDFFNVPDSLLVDQYSDILPIDSRKGYSRSSVAVITELAKLKS